MYSQIIHWNNFLSNVFFLYRISFGLLIYCINVDVLKFMIIDNVNAFYEYLIILNIEPKTC